jgi:LysM repeat protein
VTGRSPARLLAPLALVVTVVALFAVVSSGGKTAGESDGSVTPTASPAANGKASKKKKVVRRYTVKPGDTPSGIAEKLGVSTAALLDANPSADPNALSPGQKLKVP